MYLYTFFLCSRMEKKKNAEKLNNSQSIYLNICLQESRVFGVYIKSFFIFLNFHVCTKLVAAK